MIAPNARPILDNGREGSPLSARHIEVREEKQNDRTDTRITVCVPDSGRVLGHIRASAGRQRAILGEIERPSAGRQRAILEEIERPRIEAEKRANSKRLPLSFWLLGLYDAYGFEMEEQAWRDAKEAARQARAQRRAQRNGRIEY